MTVPVTPDNGASVPDVTPEARRIRLGDPDRVFGEIAVTPDGTDVTYAGDTTTLRNLYTSISALPLYHGRTPAQRLGLMARLMSHGWVWAELAPDLTR